MAEYGELELNVRLRWKLHKRRRRRRPPKPGTLSVVLLNEESDSMAHTVTYGVPLPALPPKADVVKRKLTVDVEGMEANVLEAACCDEMIRGITVEVGKTFTLTLPDVDTAGQVSEPSDPLTMVAGDPPPAKPGTLNVVVLGEELDGAHDHVEPTPEEPVEPAPEPTPEEPVEPEPATEEPEPDVPADPVNPAPEDEDPPPAAPVV